MAAIDPDTEVEGLGSTRALGGTLGAVQNVLNASIPLAGIAFILDVPARLGFLVYSEQYIGLFLTLVLVSVFIGVRAGSKSSKTNLPWYDAILALASLPVGLFIVLYYPEIAQELGELTPERVILGGLAIVLILEALRRVAGLPLVILLVVFIIYALHANHFPGPFRMPATTPERLTSYLYLDPNSMLNMLSIGGSEILAFVLFGNALAAARGGDFLTNLSIALFGRFRGAAAKVAIVSSGLFGTISGSVVANVVITGIITIPMMKRAGLKPHVAGAVESVASTGGQLMPPVMGVTAFIIATLLGVPYAEVALAATIPAILFYVALFIQVDLESAKLGHVGLPASEIPAWLTVMQNGALIFFGPLLVLLLTLFWWSWSPEKSAITATLSVLVLSVFVPRSRIGLRGLWQMLADTGRVLAQIGVMMAAAGLFVGLASISGLAFNLSLILTEAAGGSLILLLVLSAIVSVVLGMGMPTTASYVLVAVLVVPTLIGFGVQPMAAHLFLFYFAALSAITPPVAVGCFAAAALANANPDRIAFTSMRLALLAYLMPFLFVFSPELIMVGSPGSVTLAFVTAVFGAMAIGIALVGYLFSPISLVGRVVAFLGGLGLLIPVSSQWSIAANVAGALILATTALISIRERRARESSEIASGQSAPAE